MQRMNFNPICFVPFRQLSYSNDRIKTLRISSHRFVIKFVTFINFEPISDFHSIVSLENSTFRKKFWKTKKRKNLIKSKNCFFFIFYYFNVKSLHISIQRKVIFMFERVNTDKNCFFSIFIIWTSSVTLCIGIEIIFIFGNVSFY